MHLDTLVNYNKRAIMSNLKSKYLSGKSIILITVIFFTCNTTLLAQRADFSGNWMLKDLQSISGKLYFNGVPKQMKVTQRPIEITIGKITDNGKGENITSSEIIEFNGKPFETTSVSQRKKVITIKWSNDQKSFTETSNIFSAVDTTKLEFTITDRWNLEVGKLIMIRRNQNFTNGEVWESKAVYEKVNE